MIFFLIENSKTYEDEQNKVVSISSVKNRLKNNYEYWKSIGVNKFVLNVIKNGYAIAFISKLVSTFKNNNQTALQNAEFVTKAIKKLVDNNYVTEVFDKPYIVNPLSVSVQKSGKNV